MSMTARRSRLLLAALLLAAAAGGARAGCRDHVQDGDEEGVDCGAACGVACPDCSVDVQPVLLDRAASGLSPDGRLTLAFTRSAFVTAASFRFLTEADAADAASAGAAPVTPCDTAAAAGSAAWEVEVAGGDSCDVTHTLVVDWNDALRSCAFEQVDTDEFTQFRTVVRVETTEPAGRLDGADLTKTVHHSVRLVVQYPRTVTVSTGDVLEVVGDFTLLSAISRQTFALTTEEGGAEAVLTLRTSSSYPYELYLNASRGDGVSLVEGTGLEVAVEQGPGTDLDCPRGVESCEQEWYISVRPGPDTCTLNAKYSVQLSVRCLPEYVDVEGACPGLAQNSTVFEFTTRTDSFCARVVEVASLEGSLPTFLDASFEVESTTFVMFTDAFAEARLDSVEGGIEVESTELQQFGIEATSGGTVVTTLLWNLGVATPTGAGAGIEVESHPGGDVTRHRVSFQLSSGAHPTFATSATFVASLGVQYADVADQKRSVLVRSLLPAAGARARAAAAVEGDADVSVDSTTEPRSGELLILSEAPAASGSDDTLLGLQATTWVAMGVVVGMVLVVALSVQLVRRVRHTMRFDRVPRSSTTAELAPTRAATSTRAAASDGSGEAGSEAASTKRKEAPAAAARESPRRRPAAVSTAATATTSGSGSADARADAYAAAAAALSAPGGDDGADWDDDDDDDESVSDGQPYRGRPSRDHLDANRSLASGFGGGAAAAPAAAAAAPAAAPKKTKGTRARAAAASTKKRKAGTRTKTKTKARASAEGRSKPQAVEDQLYFDEDDEDSTGMATEEDYDEEEEPLEGTPSPVARPASPRAVPQLNLAPLARSSSSASGFGGGGGAAAAAAAGPGSSRLQQRRQKLASLERFDPNSAVDLDVLGSTPRVPNLGAYAHVMTPRTATPGSAKMLKAKHANQKAGGGNSPRRSRIPQRPVSARMPAPEREEKKSRGKETRGRPKTARGRKSGGGRAASKKRSKSRPAREYAPPHSASSVRSAPGGGRPKSPVRAGKRGKKRAGTGGKKPRRAASGRLSSPGTASPSPNDLQGIREAYGSLDETKGRRSPRKQAAPEVFDYDEEEEEE